MSEETGFEYISVNLCDICKYTHKCPRLGYIHQQLLQLESEALATWRINLETDYLIEECDLYSLDIGKLQIIKEDGDYGR